MWRSVLYYGFCVLLCLPAVVLLFAGVYLLDGYVTALLPVRTAAEETRYTLQALAVAAPGIAVELAAFYAWLRWRERRGGRL